jgi:FkbM family methyltransferase
MYLGLFEPAETRLVKELLLPGDVFVDIGAHIGWYTTLGSQLVEKGSVIAFEPYPANALTLKENLHLNHCSNVLVVETALGEQSGTTFLASSGGDSGSVTALSWARDGRIEVPEVTLDEIDANIDFGPAALVKIDVEGWESHVIGGARKTLSRAKRVLVEINLPALDEASSSQGEIFDLLRNCGFTNFFHVFEGGLRRFSSKAVSNVLATKAFDVIGSRSHEDWGLSRRSISHLRRYQV